MEVVYPILYENVFLFNPIIKKLFCNLNQLGLTAQLPDTLMINFQENNYGKSPLFLSNLVLAQIPNIKCNKKPIIIERDRKKCQNNQNWK